jgi:hypothetical protein
MEAMREIHTASVTRITREHSPEFVSVDVAHDTPPEELVVVNNVIGLLG